jgi:predicted nucleic acid-binding protein
MADAYYWDACVFLALVNGEPARLQHIESMMEAASKGELVILTSTFSKVEVALGASEQQAKVLDKAVEDKIDELWGTGSPVKLVEFHELLADDARNLIRQGITRGWSLKPTDALHLATAMRHGTVAFHTYDKPLRKYSGQIGITIEEPVSPAPYLPLPPNPQPPT